MPVDKPVTQPSLATVELQAVLNDEFEDAGIPYKAHLHGDQFAYLTTGLCTGKDLQKLAEIVWDKHRRYFVVNTGTHGTEDGSINVYFEEKHYKDVEKFIKQDTRNMWNKDGVSLHIVSKLSAPIYPLDKDSADAWCLSERNFDQRLANSRQLGEC
jgi:hypothetical protein